VDEYDTERNIPPIELEEIKNKNKNTNQEQDPLKEKLMPN